MNNPLAFIKVQSKKYDKNSIQIKGIKNELLSSEDQNLKFQIEKDVKRTFSEIDLF
jgi:hypothetical protein